ncbi:MAG: sodium-dependent transporter [Clostridia bacterium]|nr:sodium-dependent transporter [Clostridia bacterium]
MQREKFSSRLGFILISAGCAIGLGNVWRFPYIVGQYGGAAFVLIYLVFLAIFGLPIMTMEFAVGRASQKGPVSNFKVLEPKGTKWHVASPFMVAGNYLLMMFYTVITGWMLNYVVKFATGQFTDKTPAEVGGIFEGMLGSWTELGFWMIISVLIGFGVCNLGLKNGVEKITKVMMVALLGIMLVLAVRSLTLGGKAIEGLKFYLVPDFGKIKEAGIGQVLYAALGQSFFTLSIGIGSMAIFGSYISKERRLFGESLNICLLDTFVAFTAGLIIFPACFAYNVDPGEGAGLAFVTLPNIFIQLKGGQIIGTLFFLFLAFAALSTLIAVFENIISFAMDGLGWSRTKAVTVNMYAMILLSMPAVLGMNVLADVVNIPFIGSIDSLEDFIVSQNLLPLGSLVYLLFCVTKKGWGWDNFIAEADEGKGLKFPKFAKVYLKYILPVLIIAVFVIGYLDKFGVI